MGKCKTKSPGNNNSISWCLDSLSQQHIPSASFPQITTFGFKRSSSKRSHTGTPQELSHFASEVIKSLRATGETRPVAGEGEAQSFPPEAEHPPEPLQRGKAPSTGQESGVSAACTQQGTNSTSYH